MFSARAVDIQTLNLRPHKAMKLLIFACLAVAALASPINEEPEWQEIDWTKVVPITDIPGFWDGRDIRPSEFETSKREPRIVGG